MPFDIYTLTSAEQYELLVQIQTSIDNNEYQSLFDFCKKNCYQYNQLYHLNKNLKVLTLTCQTNGKNNGKVSKLSEKDIDTITTLYNSGKTQHEIGLIYGLSAGSICHFFKKFNIKARDKKTTGKMVWLDESRREQQRIRSTNNYLKRRKFDTQPEREFKQWCSIHNIRYIEQYRKVGNAHPYDFFLPDYNLLVEIDGHYWHSKPKQKEKDKKHVDDAIRRGYNIVRIDTEELKEANGDYNKWLKILKN